MPTKLPSHSSAAPGLDALPEFAAIRRTFEETLPGRLALLHQLAASGQFEELARQAHMLKGSAGNFGRAELGQLAGTIEQHLRQGDVATALGALDHIDTHHQPMKGSLA
ncbi:MAG: Hpt domain-containing protein [Pseudomonadota bacterium]